MKSHPLNETGRVTKRLVVSLIGCALVWFFLDTHRAWVWAYFDSMMLMPKPSAELASVAGQSIAAITTIAITGITGIVGIVMFFITGNVAVLSSMFKFSSAGQAIGNVASEVTSNYSHEEIEQTLRQFNTPELKERYAEK